MSALTIAPAPVRNARARDIRPVASGAGQPAMRLRWDRLAAVAVVLLLIGVLLSGFLVDRSSADAVPAAPIAVVLQPGDTLWDLARSHAPAGVDTFGYIEAIEAHNGVTSGHLVPGQLLELPQ